MFGDDCGRNYTNSQSADQNRQDAISRVLAVQERERLEVRAMTVWQLKHIFETYGHINRAGCEGMATVTAAHNSIWNHLYHSMHAAKKPRNHSSLSRLTKKII